MAVSLVTINGRCFCDLPRPRSGLRITSLERQNEKMDPFFFFSSRIAMDLFLDTFGYELNSRV